MTRTRGSLRRAGLVTTVLLTALPMSACSLAIPSDASSTPTPSASSTTAPETGSTAAPAGSGFTFEDGTTLSSSAHIEWADGLFADDGWTLTAPDDGNGNWGYTSADGACTAAFWQGLLDGLTLTGDDSTNTDALLAYFLNAEVSDVTSAAYDQELSYQVAGSGGLEARAVVGQQDDRTWIITARAFGSAGVGVYTLVDCTGADAQAVVDEVNAQNAVVVI